MRTLIRENWQLAVIIIVGLLARAAASLYLGNQVEILPGIYDQVSYHNLALRLVNGHGLTFGEVWWPWTQPDAPTAHWSFLYTAYLALIYKVFGPTPIVARLIQILIVGVLQPVLAYLLGQKIFGKSVGLVAAALTVIYGYFVYYSAALMTEPFYITSILASLYLAILLVEAEGKAKQQKLALGLGLSLGTAILLRQLFVIFVPCLFMWAIWARYRRYGSISYRALLITSMVIFLMIIPFTIYNYSRFDRFVLLNTNAGYAFFWANHPIYGTHFEPILKAEMGNYQSLIPVELRDLDEAAMDQALLRQGVEFVVEDPIRYIRLSISRIPAYFMFWPSADSSLASNITRVFSFGIMLPFMIYGLVLSLLRRLSKEFLQDPVFLLTLFIGLYTLIHLLSWSLIRYRLPVDAVGLIFAAVAIVHLLSKVKIGGLELQTLSYSDR